MHPLGLGRLVASAGTSPTAHGHRAPIHSHLHGLPYRGHTAVSQEHWDGSARRRNVDPLTERLGDGEFYPSRGSGGPGDV